MKVAIIGGGISGLGAAYLLSQAHDVQVFEKASKAGGHTRTVRSDGLSLDMGFLVHNERNYPLLTRLFRELGVATQDSEMSFSVSCTCGLEYSSSHPFAQSRRLADPRHLLSARGDRALAPDSGQVARGAGKRRLDAGALPGRAPILAAVSSTLSHPDDGRSLVDGARAGARVPRCGRDSLLRESRHARLPSSWLAVRHRRQRFLRARDRRSARQRACASDVASRSIRRDADGVDLTAADGSHHRFDAVVIATHADQALTLLDDASPAEARILGAFQYTTNETILHTDESHLPATSCRARILELPGRRREQADRHLLPQPSRAARV